MVFLILLIAYFSQWVWLPDIFSGLKVVEGTKIGDASYFIVQEFGDDFYYTRLIVIREDSTYVYVLDPDGDKMWAYNTQISLSEDGESIVIDSKGKKVYDVHLSGWSHPSQYDRTRLGVGPASPDELEAIEKWLTGHSLE